MNINPPRVLYVDDDEDSCEVMKLLLVNAFPALKVDTVNSGREAIRIAREDPYDVYILDALLPGITGFDICKSIREFDQTTPIYFYSAMSGNENPQRATAAGCSEYLVKPNDMDKLLGKVSEVVESRADAMVQQIGSQA